MGKSVAIFYSQNANLVLAAKVKECLNKFNIYTIYLKDIDDIILKKFTDIDLLILDYMSNQLDAKSQQLINKLHEDEYIKRLLVIKNDNFIMNYDYPSITYEEDFCSRFTSKIKSILSTPLQERKICDSHWYKIIGNYLLNIGFSLKQAGYSMMIDAIIYIMSNNGTIKKLNDDIYAYLAIKYDKKISCVEMNIRKSIKMAFERSKDFPFSYCPTNKEFITYVVTQLYDKIYIRKVI